MEEIISSLEFNFPLFLLIWGLIIFLVFLPKFKQKQLRCNLKWFKRKVKLTSKKTWTISILIIVVSGFLALALVNPQIVTRKRVPVVLSRSPVLVVIDVSGSMEPGYSSYARPDYDYPVLPRFQRAKEIFYNITQRDLGVSFGLMLYSTDSYNARDFTDEPEHLKGVLEDGTKIRKMSRGTETALALAEARIYLLEKGGEDLEKAIVLISDLEDDLSEIGQEVRRGVKQGIQYYVIVIQPSVETALSYKAKLEIEARGEIEVIWQGDPEGIDQICQGISQIKGIYEEEEEIVSRHGLISFFLPPIIVLVVLIVICSETYFRKIP